MGYTHYYYVSEEYKKSDFAKLVKDFKKILPALSLKISDQPVQDPILEFNEDGSIKDTLSKTGKINDVLANGNGEEGTKPTINSEKIIFNGVGEQAHETFCLERKREPRQYEQQQIKNGKKIFFEFTKTARKPYDLAVCSALIIAKQYLNDKISIHSDGSIKDEWVYPKKFVQEHLGYGNDFVLDEEEQN